MQIHNRNEMPDIIITEPLNKLSQLLYQGPQSTRYATLTDVKYINETQIVVAHRYAGKIYIIDISGSSHNIISEYVHMPWKQGQVEQTEAFELNSSKNRIYLISYSQYLFILDILSDKSIKLIKTMKLNGTFIPYHGIRLYKEHLYVTPSAAERGFENIKKINVHNYNVVNMPSLGNNLRIKHIAFLNNGTILVAINYKTITTMAMPNHVANGCLRLYSNDFKTIHDSIELPNTHLDGMAYDNNTFYITCRDLINGFILCGTVSKNDKIIENKRISCNDFPHGIDILNNRIAYTSYSTSGVHFIDV